MILRPRQVEFVEACNAALDSNGNTLGVAPTGAGKTVCLSAVAGKFDSSLILQHRDELVAQNRATFRAVNPRKKSDIFNAQRKVFAKSGATFAMIQTLVGHPEKQKPVDLIVIDETHRVGANSYIKILKRARELNPRVQVLGVSATPERADGKSLRHVFDNVADVISLAELVATGHLVRPRTFVIDLDLREQLGRVKQTAGDYDMSQVDDIMNTAPLNAEIVRNWAKTAGQRHTVVFTSTVSHAEELQKAWREAGCTAEVIHGKLSKGERKRLLDHFDKRKFQVLLNCAVLTEGWDCQPVDCVVLCRPCSHRSTLIQMIGRGLRKVDQERYPGAVKDDCMILDFGYSLLTYPDIFEINHANMSGEALECPKCETKLPPKIRYCPICGYEFPYEAPEATEEDDGGGSPVQKQELKTFQMTEIELCKVSPFRWETLFNGSVLVAGGMTAEAFLLYRDGFWFAVGKVSNQPARLLYKTHDKVAALSVANDFMCLNGDKSAAQKTKRWLNNEPTERQCELLDLQWPCFSINRYRASCMVGFKFAKGALELLTQK